MTEKMELLVQKIKDKTMDTMECLLVVDLYFLKYSGK